MSPLFRERVLIALTPSSLAFARVRGIWRPRLELAQRTPCDARAGSEPWRGAVQALAAVAAQLHGTRCDVTVVLSNHFARYLLVRGQRLHGGEEALAFARYCFGSIHGERSKAWDLRLGRPDAAAARVASAIDRELLQAIIACFPAGAASRLISVQPFLMAACNRMGRYTRKDCSWLLLEPQLACVATRANGRWAAVRCVKGQFDDPAQWAVLLDRERYLVGVPDPAAPVLVPGAAADGGELSHGAWRFRRVPDPELAGFSPLRYTGPTLRSLFTPRLELDYVGVPRQRPWIAVAVLAVALLTAADLVSRYRDARRDLAALDLAQGLLRVERGPAKAPGRERLDEETRRVNDIVRQLTLPWMQMMAAVEKAGGEDVVILQMQPEAPQRLLRLTAEARDREAMLGYVERLSAEPSLAEVHLLRHDVRLDRPGRPVVFAVQARLKEPR